MSEKPILFNGEMVRAILDGRKTQTRRVIKPQPAYVYHEWQPGIIYDCRIADPRCCDFNFKVCPYGSPGNTLWVRETWGYANSSGYDSPADNRQNTYQKDFVCPIWYRATDNGEMGGPWSPSIFMPRWASRITLRVAAVRVEQVQEISEADASAEGVDYIPSAPAALNHRTAFKGLWNSINAKRGYSWESKPWVWVVEFEAIP